MSTIFTLPLRYLVSYALLGISVTCYTGFWIWGIIHASSTPKASLAQRLYWAGAMVVNPATIIWYWYIWKRWAFWLLFSPILGAFISFPFVVRSLLTKAAATRLTNTLFALGTQQLVIIAAVLMIFPLILRLAALFHLGRNTKLSAMDRNDWVVALAFPVFGFGAGLVYTSRNQRPWALVSLVWLVAVIFAGRYMLINVTQALVPAGDERREQFRELHMLPPAPDPGDIKQKF